MTDTSENSHSGALLACSDLSPEELAALDHAVATQAERDPSSRTSRAQLSAQIISEWLRAHGHLRHSGGDEGLRPEDLTSENDR